MYWLLGAVGSGAVAVVTLFGCGKGRETAKKAPPSKAKSASSTRRPSSKSSGRSKKGHSTRSGKSSKSGRSHGSRSGKSAKKPSQHGKSEKSAKSARSQKTQKSEKSLKSAKSSKSSKSSKSGKSMGGKKSEKSKKMNAALAAARGDNVTQKQAEKDVKLESKELFRTVEVQVSPAELCWKKCGGLQNVRVVNNSNEKRALKVKCSDNMMYRVSPVYSFVNPHESIKIDVLRNNGPEKIDKLVIVTAPADSSDPKSCFTDSTIMNEMLVLPLLVDEQK